MKRGFGRREKCVGVMGSQRKRKGVAVWVRKKRAYMYALLRKRRT
jgi:hypothetical protein